MFSLKSKSLVLILGLVLSGCAGAPDGESYQRGPLQLTTNFQGGTRAASSVMREQMNLHKSLFNMGSAQGLENKLQALYFGELEVVAYNYRPGQAIQAHATAGGFDSADWSHWVILQSGHPAARNNLLKRGNQLDVSTLNKGYDTFPSENLAFINEVQKFGLDFVEVYANRTGIVHDNQYYGFDDGGGVGGDILYKYAHLAGIQKHNTYPNFPGVERRAQEVSVLFARNDWFPVPIVVQMNPWERMQIDSASVPLTVQQEQVITSLIANGSKRRTYENLVIVPFKFDGQATVLFPTDKLIKEYELQQGPGRETMTVSRVDPKAWADNIKIDVSFDLESPIFNESELPNVTYLGDSGNVPFGLNVSISNATTGDSTAE